MSVLLYVAFALSLSIVVILAIYCHNIPHLKGKHIYIETIHGITQLVTGI
jgi:hypothetical protein